MTPVPDRDLPPCLAEFPHKLTDNIRFADLDPNGHVNNTVYATYFETSRVTLLRDDTSGLTAPGASWVVVRLDIHFRAELHWPGTIDLGLGIAKLGRTSVSYRQGVFSDGVCVATANAVTVMVDRVSRKPTPLTEAVIANFQKWMIASAER